MSRIKWPRALRLGHRASLSRSTCKIDTGENNAGMTARERVKQLIKAFPKVYPTAHCELDFRNPLQLLVATILSAQCTDKRVNMVTPFLFRKYRTARIMRMRRRLSLRMQSNRLGFIAARRKAFVRPCAQSQRNTVEKYPTRWRN